MSEIILEPIQANQIDFLTDHRSVSLYYSWLKIGNVGTMADFLEWVRSGAMVEPEFQEFFSEYEEYLLNLKLLPAIEPETGSPSKYLNEQGEWFEIETEISHDSTTNKNGNPNFQHLNQEQVDAVNSIGKLIVDYTHSGNKEVYVSAYNAATGVFTSIGHGLVNGNTVGAIINSGLTTYPVLQEYAAAALWTTSRYFVVQSDLDSFKLSTTSGGAPVVFIMPATVNLSKWHFEVNPPDVINFTGLNLNCFHVVMKVKRACAIGGTTAIEINGLETQNSSTRITNNKDVNIVIKTNGSSIGACDVMCRDFVDSKTVVVSNNLSNGNGNDNTTHSHFIDYPITLITSLRFTYVYPANGYNIKIYKL